MGSIAAEPGAYVIIHNPTGRFYVGSTKNLQSRITAHRGMLRRGVHHSERLQESFTTLDDISIEVAVAGSVEEARTGEQVLLDTYLTDPNCCNVGTGAASLWKPGTMPEYVADRTRQHATGNQYAKGHVVSDEARESVRQANSGLKRDPATLDRMSTAKDHLKRPIEIDGVRYAGMREAVQALGISAGTIRTRVDSKTSRFPGWKYV